MSTGFTFGAKTTAATTPAFGSTSFTFGNAISAAPNTTPSLFGTPTVAPTTTTTALFGAPTTSAGLFATPTVTTTATAPNSYFGAPSFGATPATTTSTGLTFGAPTSSAAPSFGLGSAQTTPASFGALNTSINAPASTTIALAPPSTTTVSAPSFGFGLATTTSGGLKLGTTPATTATANLSFGLGGLAPTSSVASNLAPTTTAAVSSSAPVGLGGIATSTQSKTVTTHKEIPPKDQPLPNEILQTVEAFKEMVKQQKAHSSDISRCSVRDFRRVEQEIDQLSSQLNEVENQLQKNRQIAEKLKYDTAKTVQNVEMAQRTHDTPPGLQYENTAPLRFFLNLADQFERDMQNLKMQIEAADKYVKNHKNPDSLTPQDLAMGMRRLHDTFVALAGRLQSVHSQVESQKETYLNIRKHLLQDASNPFDKLIKAPEFHETNVQNAFMHSPPKVATGPTPFNNLALRTINGGTPQQHNAPPPAYPGTSANTSTGFGATGFGTQLGGTQPSNTSLFGSSFNQSFNSSFQLQKPPTGNKRGKI